MGDDFQKVKAGDKFRMPARAYNAFIDAARDFQNRQQSADGSAQPGAGIDPTVVLVKNATGSDQNRYAVLGINGPIYTPDDNIDSFKNKLAFIAAIPTAASHTGKFAILLEPAADNAIVPAVISGVVPVNVDFSDANHGYADVNDGLTSSLKSAVTGQAHILWKQSGGGVKWALVRVGNPPAGLPVSCAQITAVTAINGGVRWKYTIQLGYWNMASSPATGGAWMLTGSTTYFAFNSAEDMNTFSSGTGTIGTGNTSVKQSDGTIGSTTCKLKPLPVGAFVQVVRRGVDGSGNIYYTIINAMNSAQ